MASPRVSGDPDERLFEEKARVGVHDEARGVPERDGGGVEKDFALDALLDCCDPIGIDGVFGRE